MGALRPHAASKTGSSWKNPRFSAASAALGALDDSLRPQGRPQLESRILVYRSRRYQHVVGSQDHALVASPPAGARCPAWHVARALLWAEVGMELVEVVDAPGGTQLHYRIFN